MTNRYYIKGMTCSGCVASVKKYLSQIDGVSSIEVSLENKEVTLSLNKVIDIDVLQNVLPKKYILSQSKTHNPSLDETIFSKNFDCIIYLFFIGHTSRNESVFLSLRNTF